MAAYQVVSTQGDALSELATNQDALHIDPHGPHDVSNNTKLKEKTEMEKNKNSKNNTTVTIQRIVMNQKKRKN